MIARRSVLAAGAAALALPAVAQQRRTAATQQAIAREVEAVAFEEMPYATTGQFFIPHAIRQSVRGLVEAPLPVFWGVSA